ncbi:Shikimate 5-dehydrogenase I alpha [Desulfurella amilsii]|uniref:Shikimate dehydrogenase (NADP(+)) n=1 Tax=Desulfurella amilsii TaxID=1562698 RepID=A0A1X4XWI1_9BACT|nr:shikimate dehydrogenase [Desulfurella amilsii]OSS41899.1 Shikimate 5-dehydrogenase I alpha [Desulfurella amilsii]
MIGAQTNLYAIIGKPIKHSLSPKLHNSMFEKYNIDAVYVAFEVNNLKQAIEGIRGLGIKGINITLPFKNEAIQLVDYLDQEAKIIGSINTIKNLNGELFGFNTDYLGFFETIKDTDCSKNICILGAGGASSACIYAFYKKGVKTLNIYNRTFKNAFKLKERFSDLITLNIIEKKDVYKSEIIVNTTSVSLSENEFVLDLNLLNKNTLLVDIVYNSPLIKHAKAFGINGIDGNRMFVYQAYWAFKIWTGIEFDINYAFEVINGNH